MINLYQQRADGETTGLLKPIVQLFQKLNLTGENNIFHRLHNSLPEKNRKYYYIIGFLVLNKLLKKYSLYKKTLTPENCVLELNLDKQIFVNYTVSPGDKKIANFLNQPVKQEFTDLLETIKIASDDNKVKCLLVKMGNNLCMGLAQLYELVEVIKIFKQNGKKTVCYAQELGFGNTGILTNYLASSFDKIFVLPKSLVCIFGFQGKASFAKQTLQKLGINLEVYKRKGYKNALNNLDQDKFTDEHKESVLDILQTVEDQVKKEIAQNRNLDLDKVNELVQNGPYTSEEAVNNGLIDGIKHRDEVYSYIQEELFKDQKINYLFLTKYAEKKGGLYKKKGKNNKQVVMINACGPIMEGDSKTPDMFNNDLQIGSDTLTSQIRKAAENKNVIAMILRIDSPGGSAFASEIILREIENFKKKNKKVLALYSNVAASGGVYISCKADRIVCTPLTITGSIGVLFGHFNFRDMFQKMGITFDSARTKDTPESNIFSLTDDVTEKDNQRLNYFIDESYECFKQHVSQGRNISQEQVEEHAQGRVWMGTHALQKSLVDNISRGGYLQALQHVAEITDTPVQDLKLIKYPEEKNFIQKLGDKPAQNEKEQDQKVQSMFQNISLTQFGQNAILQTVFGKYVSQDFVTKMMQQTLIKGQNSVYAFSFESAFIQQAIVQPNLHQIC